MTLTRFVTFLPLPSVFLSFFSGAAGASSAAASSGTCAGTAPVGPSGVMMIVLADRVSEFLKKNRMYEVLGLFILFLVGVMLLSEGGHLAHIHLAGHAVEAMPKSTFYFVIGVLVIVDIVQGRYQKKLLHQERLQDAEDAIAATA